MAQCAVKRTAVRLYTLFGVSNSKFKIQNSLRLFNELNNFQKLSL
jgi:hypothetical protein